MFNVNQVTVECAQNIWNLLHGSKLAQLHEDEVGLEEDRYSLRQDCYPLRTAPQFLGPQVEDILSALAAITQEFNSSKYLTLQLNDPRPYGSASHRSHRWISPCG